MKGVLVLTVALLVAAGPVLLWSAESGADLYSAKCSACHGDKGEGNPDGGIPALKGTSMTVEKLVAYITKGDSTKTFHSGPVGDLKEDQAKAVAEYIKKMK